MPVHSSLGGKAKLSQKGKKERERERERERQRDREKERKKKKMWERKVGDRKSVV